MSAPLVWGMDQVNRLFPLAISGAFFSLLRSWHEGRHLEADKPWKRLTMAIACATEAHLYIRDLNRSPFNVGTRLELGDFTRDQVQYLNERYGSPLRDTNALDAFYGLLGGHPYLVRRGLYALTQAGCRLEDLLAGAQHGLGTFGDHLRRLQRWLEEDDELGQVLLATLEGRPCPADAFYRLRSAGLLSGSDGTQARPRCRLYAEYLRERLRCI